VKPCWPTVALAALLAAGLHVRSGLAAEISPAQSVRLSPIPADAEIAFVRAASGTVDRPNQLEDVFVMRADGENVTRLTHNQRPIRYEHAAVSPDRRYVAVNYHVRDGGRRGRPRSLLWVLDLESGSEAQLLPDWHSAGSGGIDWDREGRLYFAAEREAPTRGDGRDVYRIRHDGTGLERLTETPEGEADVAVSEDGRRVTFVRAVLRPPRGGHTELWMMGADGSDPKRVYASGTIRVESAHDPEFSPDARKLVFSQVNPAHKTFARTFNTAHDIYTIDVDGTERQRITPVGAIRIIPDWIGDRILYTEYDEAEGYTGLTIVSESGGSLGRIGPPGARAGKWIPPASPSPERKR